MKTRVRFVLPVILIASGAVLFTIGIFNGEIEIVLRKAIFICLECIGIG